MKIKLLFAAIAIIFFISSFFLWSDKDGDRPSPVVIQQKHIIEKTQNLESTPHEMGMQASSSQGKKEKKPTHQQERPLKILKPEELRKKITSIKSNKEFIKTILDIEYRAEFKEIYPLIFELYDTWVAKDALAALDYSEVLTSRFDDADFREYALEMAGQNNLEDTQAWLNQNNLGTSDERDRNILAAYSGLAMVEPTRAIQFVDEIQDSDYREQLKLRSLEEWATKEPSQALAWLEADAESTDNREYIDDGYLATVSPMINSAPQQAESIISGLQASTQKNVLIGEYAIQIASQDAESALEWAQTIEDQEEYSAAITATLEVLAGSEKTLDQAIEFAMGQSDPGLREEFLADTIAYTAFNDPVRGASELDKLPEREQAAIARNVASFWASEEPEKIQAWIEALKDPELRELALAASQDAE